MHVVPVMAVDPAQHFGNSIIHGLAVAGAAAVGYGLTFMLLWLTSKFAFNKRLPPQVRRPVCLLGAVAMGIFTWMLLFNGGEGGGWRLV